MSTDSAVILLAIASAIIIMLAAWAGHLLYKVWRPAAHRPGQAGSSDHARSSIVVLARAALAQQVDMSEACIRIATLLDYLEIDATGRRAYSTIYQLSEATVHIPRWQQWQDLTPERRAEFRKQKEALEQAHGEELRQALQTLLDIDVWK